MKVLIVGPGKSPIIKRLVHNLAQKGVEVKLASFDASGLENCYDLGQLKGLKSYFNFLKLNRIIGAFQPDVVHAHVINHYGIMACFTSKPVLLAAWGSDVLLSNKSGHFFKDLIYTVINNLVLKRMKNIHTSGSNVTKALVNDYSFDDKNISTFYWGFPVVPNCTEIRVESILENELGIKGSGFIVFNRGLGELYNPEAVAIIINSLLSKGINKDIIVFKGFANNVELNKFKQLVSDEVIIVDRLLSDEELHSIYSRTDIHFSIPKSDALGGGVIEPALLGSFPILSDLEQYREYTASNLGMIYTEDTHDEILEQISLGKLTNSKKNHPEKKYTSESVVLKFIDLYESLLSKC